MSEQGSVEATRAVLHMRQVEDRCQDGLQDVDLAIAELKNLLGSGETDDK